MVRSRALLGARRPLDVDPGVGLGALVFQRRAGTVPWLAEALAGDVGRAHEVAAAGQAPQARELAAVADHAVAAAVDRAAVDAVALVARVVAPDQDAPAVLLFLGIAQRGEGDPHLGGPAVGGELRRGVVEEVRREVLVAGAVVEERVGLVAAGVDAQLDRRAAIVPGIEKHGDVVVGADDLVPLDEGGADLLRLGIEGVDADVEGLLVVGEVDHGLRLRLGVVGRIGLIEGVEDGRLLPGVVVELAVDGDLAGQPGHGQRRADGGGLGGQRGERKQRESEGEGTGPGKHGRYTEGRRESFFFPPESAPFNN